MAVPGEDGPHFICANFNVPMHISAFWQIADATTKNRYCLDGESMRDLWMVQLLSRIQFRFYKAGQDSWILDAMEGYFPNGWLAGLGACSDMMESFGPLPEPTEPHIQCAFRQLLKAAWMWHHTSKACREEGPAEMLSSAVEITVELKRAVQAAKALGAKEEEIEEPSLEACNAAFHEILETAFMWAIMGPTTKGVVEHLENAFETARKHVPPNIFVDEHGNVVMVVDENGTVVNFVDKNGNNVKVLDEDGMNKVGANQDSAEATRHDGGPYR